MIETAKNILERSPLLEYGADVYSQNGEDGIIEEIFKRLKISEGYVCEFGAFDGRHLSNTFHLCDSNANFKSILIESNKNYYDECVENVKDHDAIVLNKKISSKSQGKNSLNHILKDLDIQDFSQKFKLISIDVDGEDYNIWKNFTAFSPDVVIIEIESSLDLNSKEDLSASSMTKLAKKKGYELVCHTGNLIFVREDLFPLIGIKDNSVETIFLKNIKTNRLVGPMLDLGNMEYTEMPARL